MKTLISLLCMFGFAAFVQAQDAQLKEYQAELSRGMQLKDKDSIAAAYCHLSEYYAYRQVDSTRYYCHLGLKYADKNQQEPYLVLLVNLASTYFDEGKIDEFLLRNGIALREAERLGYDKKNQSTMLVSRGVAYRRKEMSDSALVCYKQALAMLEEVEMDAYDEKVHLLTSMAILYSNTSRLKEGEFYARRAMEASEGCEDMDMVLYAGATAGSILIMQNKADEGVKMIHSVLARAREQRKPKFVLKSATYLLKLFYKMNKSDSIAQYVREADEVVKELPAESAEVLGYYEILSQIYNQMGRYRESLQLQQQILGVKEVNAQTPVNKLYLEMARNYKGLKDYSHAMEFYEKACSAADSLYAEQINTELSELSVRYETQEKELEIARLTREQLEQEAKTMRWSIVAAIAIFILLLFLLYYTLRRKRIKKEEELKLAKSYIDGLERERSRLAKDLHDGVCNDLLGIGMQMQSTEPTPESKQELLKLLERVRNDVRCISHELMPPQFQQTTLAEAVEAYVEQIAIPSSMQLTFGIEEEEAEWQQVPELVSYEVYRIAQELLSNVLKHSGATQVHLSLCLRQKLLALRITNDGKNRLDNSPVGKGIGLITIQERTKAVGGMLTYGIQNGKQEFKLEIPLDI